ncbi:MAG TPA: TraB/GumN family protein [Hellea balneolensis]|uniref:TraB/GumN family protein n=1 Tax=Hellea balneolensis TaxID=287478 RepID=A0A7C5R0W8_9PROT|nr:TraB/GumN family protein [Hellea balneolensis]
MSSTPQGKTLNARVHQDMPYSLPVRLCQEARYVIGGKTRKMGGHRRPFHKCINRDRIFMLIFRLLTIRALLTALCGLWLCACSNSDSVETRVAKAHKRYDAPAIWKVSDQNSTVYLFGSVHFLPDDSDWRRRDFEVSFDEVGTVFFETPDDTKAQLDISVLQRELGVYPAGDRLREHLNSAQLNRLEAAAHNANIPVEALDSFKPWMVADMLTVAAAVDAGLKPENSADEVIKTLARKRQKRVVFLDEADTYIKSVTGLPEWVQMKMLDEALRGNDKIAGEMQTLNGAWIVGNIPYVRENFIGPAAEKSPELFKVLFSDRSAKWAKTLDTFLQGDSNAMVVVGVGHMIGDTGLVYRLRELGYDVERVRRFDLPNE